MIKLENIGSTNDYVKDHKDLQEYNVVAAKIQTGGRGRRGNIWASPEGGAWFSFCIQEDRNIGDDIYGKLPFAACLSVILSLEENTGCKEFRFKWVNDIYIRDKKIGGILIEKSDGRFIIGIGININNKEFGNYGSTAESLASIFGKNYNIDSIIEETVDKFRVIFTEIVRGNWPYYYAELVNKDYLKGKKIEIETGSMLKQGIVQGIDIDGCLVLNNLGNSEKIISGSIKLI